MVPYPTWNLLLSRRFQRLHHQVFDLRLTCRDLCRSQACIEGGCKGIAWLSMESVHLNVLFLCGTPFLFSLSKDGLSILCLSSIVKVSTEEMTRLLPFRAGPWDHGETLRTLLELNRQMSNLQVQKLMDMGFSKSAVIQALQDAHGDENAALELILSRC